MFFTACSNGNLAEKEFPDLSQEDKQYLISVAELGVKDFFEGRTIESKWPKEYGKIKNDVEVVLRLDGEVLGDFYLENKAGVAESIYQATIKILAKSKISEEKAKSLKIHIFLLGNEKVFDSNFELGIHALMVRKTSSNKLAVLDNVFAITGNYKVRRLFEKLCQKANLSIECFGQEGVEFFYFNTLHFGQDPFSDDVVTFYRGNVLLEEEVNEEMINDSLQLAKKWLIKNLKSDGQFVYIYNPANGDYSNDNNAIRQLMASRLLAELSQEDESLRDLHKKNLDYIFANWYKQSVPRDSRDGDFGYIELKGNSKIGSMAMALRTLVYSHYFEEYKKQAQKLVNTILAMQNEDGSFKAWFIEPYYQYDEDYLMTFYSGEAILSLLDYHEKTGDEKVLEAAKKSQDFYLEKYVTHLEENYYPAYVPWHSQSLNKLYKITKDKKYAEAIFILNDKLLEIQNAVGLPYKDLKGRFYSADTPQYGTPHSASDSVYVEGLAYGYEIAKMLGDKDHEERYRTAILLGVKNLINLQYKGPKMYFMKYPERVEGAIKYRVDDIRIRIDTTQHTIDAFRKILEVL